MSEKTRPANAISVIIPARNEAAALNRLLPHLIAQGFDDIIVADNSCDEHTAAAALSFPHVRVVKSPTGRGPALNAGAGQAHGDILLFLHADTALPPNAGALIRQALASADVAGGCFRLAFDEERRAFAVYAFFTRFETLFTTFGDQAYFMPRTVFELSGGFPCWPILEDVDMRCRLKRLGRFVKLPAAVTTSSRRFARYGPLAQQMRNVLILTLFFAGISPARLARLYRPHAG